MTAERTKPPAGAGGQELAGKQSLLREELAMLRARCAQIVNADDCAYEKALQRAYERLIEECERRLAAAGD